MAESAVSFVLEKLANLLIEETLFLYGVKAEVKWLQKELKWMQCFLIDAEKKRRGGQSEVMKNWLREVREVAHQAEDIIDIFNLEVEINKTQKKKKKNKRVFLQRLIKRYTAFPCALISRHNVGTEILSLKADIEHIKKGKEEYKLSETATTATTANENLRMRRRIYEHLNDTTLVVGLDVHKKEIADRLLDIKRRCVVSIFGIGGLGKTTLAKKVYNEIKGKFDVSACISVSEDYKVQEIYKELARQMMGKTMADLQSYVVVELSDMLREFLIQRRYLIVLDDVWSPDVCDDLMREALPEVNGSRVLLTTRLLDVAKSIDPTPYELPFLNEDDSWDLFLNKAFLSYQEASSSRCPKELEEISRPLVKRCGGLPLALEVLGGILLAKGPNSVAWTSVAEHFVWSSSVDGGNCSKILGLSYDNLPHHHLKSCFLYLGVFPEDLEIRAQQLIELWVAEGFIPQLETQLMEDTAYAYLEELANRSMIQVVKKDWLGDSASVESFRIHDLFRDLCIREAREDDFFLIYNKTNSTTSLQDAIHGKNLRRLVVHGVISTTTINADLRLPPNLKSILHFGSYENPFIIIPDGLKLLRVIHLVEVDNQNVEKFPEIFDKMITNMRHLRYIRLSGYSSEFEFLPPCIQNLSNLQTLDLCSGSNVTVLPDWLGEIRTLRHLYLNRYGASSVSCLGDVGSLTNLQTLYVPINVRELMKHGLEKLLDIRNLKVSNLELDGEEQLRVFIDSLRKMKYLSELTVFYSIIPTELLSGLSENTHLRYLMLSGPIISVLQPVPESLQHGFRFPPNLTTLKLRGSKLAQDPMATLEKLPYLRKLRLQYDAYKGKEMVCTSGGFPRLQRLELKQLHELKEWRVEDGAMPNLIALHIFLCSNLKTLPEGMQHLRSLRTLKLWGYPKDRVRPEVGEDWYKIKHVPQIQNFI